MRGRHEKNCIALGLVDESVESFTEWVVLSGVSDELQISQGFMLGWLNHAKREIRMCLPKKWRVSSTVSMMLKSRVEHLGKLYQQKAMYPGKSVD